MSKPTSKDVELFVRGWVAKHVHVQPNLTNLPLEVDRLAACLTGDARAEGISGGDLHRALGDIDTYLTERYSLAAAL